MQEITNIGCTIEKTNPYDKSKMQSKFIRLSKIGLNVAYTITTHEPNLYVQHSNMIIEIRKVDKMYAENTILESRAEQSRAEQSRAEQSRAEQSRAEQLDVCRIGNLNGFDGGSYAGQVYSKDGIAPTLTDMQGGGRQPHIIEVKKMGTNILGNIEADNKHQSGNVYDSNCPSPNIMAGTHGYGMGYICEQQIVAMRGRDKDNPSIRGKSTENYEQRLEPNSQGIANTITSVQKDNLVLEKDLIIDDLYENREPRVYEDISPSLRSERNGLKTIKIRQATKDGFIDCEIGGVADLNYPSSNTRRGRVIEGGRISPTLTTENIPSLIELGNPDFYNFLYEIDGEIYLIRIRKLIPRECLCLMDVDEDIIDRMEKVESNTNLYKAAGNSIVVNCLVAILGQFFEGKENVYKEINKCD